MASNAMVLLTMMTIEEMHIDPLDDQPDGSYFVSTATIGGENFHSAFLNLLMFELSGRYPQYTWRRTSQFNQPGTLVHWYRQKPALERGT